MRAAAAVSPSSRSISAAVRIMATGLARPVPAMSGAVPWIGSKMPGPPSPSEADGREPDAARDRGGEVGEDVAEQVLGDDHVVRRRLLDQLHRHRVDELVVELDVGVARPPPRRDARQSRDVSSTFALSTLVTWPRRRRGELEAPAEDAVDLVGAVAAGVEGAVAVVPAVAEVEAAGQLAHDQEVEALDELGPQRRLVHAPP